MTGEPYGERPNGQGFPVDPRLEWIEDAEAELAERFAREDRLADYTPAEANLMVIEALLASDSSLCSGEAPEKGTAAVAVSPRRRRPPKPNERNP